MVFVSDLIEEFRGEYPHVKYDLYSGNSDDLRRSIDENKLDIAFLLEPVETAKYERFQLNFKERWGLICRKKDFPPELRFVTIEDVVKIPLILPKRNILQEKIGSWFGTSPDKLQVIGYQNLLTNSLEMIKKAWLPP